MKSIPLFTLASLKISALPSAIVSSGVMWLIASGVNYFVFGQPIGVAILVGLVVLLLHWVGELWHHYGHAWAARRVGYPMIGIRLWFFLGQSLYPKDEPALPGRTHITRALGGPLFSFGLSGVAGLLCLAFAENGGVGWGLLLFVCLENLAIFSVGALIPLGFNDGTTILNWWGK